MLGKMADRRAVEPLMQLLQRANDDHNFVACQQQIVIALGALGDERARVVLIAIAQSSGNLSLRLAAAQALTRLGDAQGTEIFQQFTGETA